MFNNKKIKKLEEKIESLERSVRLLQNPTQKIRWNGDFRIVKEDGCFYIEKFEDNRWARMDDNGFFPGNPLFWLPLFHTLPKKFKSKTEAKTFIRQKWGTEGENRIISPPPQVV